MAQYLVSVLAHSASGSACGCGLEQISSQEFNWHELTWPPEKGAISPLGLSPTIRLDMYVHPLLTSQIDS